MKPLIGINLDVTSGPPERVDLQATYYESILSAGGVPVLLPPMSDDHLEVALDALAGIVLCGGDDYSPARYGEEIGPKTNLLHPKRDDFDFRLLQGALGRAKMPILAICTGCQLLNIGFGGSLIQDIGLDVPGSTVKHKGEAGWKVRDWHDVEFEPTSQLASIYKIKRLSVPTAHHQGIKVLGKGLKAAARTDDGLVEALEAPGRPFTIGVVWHPERDYAGNEVLFKEFLRHAEGAAVKQG